MPTYEYECTACGDRFERQHRMTETVTDCPACGGRVRKVFHAPGITTRGQGACPMDTSMPACAPGGG